MFRFGLRTPTWTLTVRITHWLVASSALINTFNDTGYIHRVIGYACVAMVLLRVAHGLRKQVVSSSRFYFPSFQLIKQHILEVKSGQVMLHQRHNPLGMLVVYIFWLLIALLALSGWLSRTDAYWGEDMPVLIHRILSNLLLGLICLHVLAVLVMSKLQKQNLIKRMLSDQS